MKTDVIVVSSTGRRMEAALAQVDKVAAYKGLSEKGKTHLRLLAEEMMGLMRSVTGETEGRFWIEDEDGVYRLCLEVETTMTSEKREQLLSASTSGKNESARGLMGWVRDFFDRGTDEDVALFATPMLSPGMMESTSTPALDWEWSMLRYEDYLQNGIANHSREAQEAWDELEKSVVVYVADEVRVSIRGRRAAMTIFKKLS